MEYKKFAILANKAFPLLLWSFMRWKFLKGTTKCNKSTRGIWAEILSMTSQSSQNCFLWQLLLPHVDTILSSQEQSITGTSGLVQACSQKTTSWNYYSCKCFHAEVHNSQSVKTANTLYQVCDKQLNKKSNSWPESHRKKKWQILGEQYVIV